MFGAGSSFLYSPTGEAIQELGMVAVATVVVAIEALEVITMVEPFFGGTGQIFPNK